MGTNYICIKVGQGVVYIRVHVQCVYVAMHSEIP